MACQELLVVWKLPGHAYVHANDDCNDTSYHVFVSRPSCLRCDLTSIGTGDTRGTQATMTTAAAPGETKGRAAPGRATQDSAPASNIKAGT